MYAAPTMRSTVYAAVDAKSSAETPTAAAAPPQQGAGSDSEGSREGRSLALGERRPEYERRIQARNDGEQTRQHSERQHSAGEAHHISLLGAHAASRAKPQPRQRRRSPSILPARSSRLTTILDRAWLRSSGRTGECRRHRSIACAARPGSPRCRHTKRAAGPRRSRGRPSVRTSCRSPASAYQSAAAGHTSSGRAAAFSTDSTWRWCAERAIRSSRRHRRADAIWLAMRDIRASRRDSDIRSRASASCMVYIFVLPVVMLVDVNFEVAVMRQPHDRSCADVRAGACERRSGRARRSLRPKRPMARAALSRR